MSRLLVCGAFGQANPGDEALLAACAGVLRDHELLVTTSGDALDDTVSGFEPVAPRASDVGRALQRVDGVVVAGGTVFKMLHPSTGRHPLGLLAQTALLELAASTRAVPLALAGVGAGPLRGRFARRLTRAIADRADLLVLRDEESAAVLRDAAACEPFRVGADLAWTLLDHPALGSGSRSARAEGNGVLVVLSHHASHDQEQLARSVASIVDHLHDFGVPVHLQPWQGGPGSGDDRLAAMVCEAARSAADVRVVPPPVDLFDAVARAGSVHAVVGYRFHALIAAAAAGRPFLAVSHEPKLSGLARRLQQPSVPPHAPSAVLRTVVSDLLDQAPPSQALIDREVDLAGATLDLMRVVVTRGADDELLDHRRTELTSGVPW